jgi:D-alanyl-D-alanine carboxypeptidase/D-alanyl-D-alanine-endopeptidase (penicillin-binding protein 4)
VSSFDVPEPQLFVLPPPVLADGSQVRPADADALAGRLDGLIAADGLGGHVGLAVAVLGSDDLLYAHNATDSFTPASTMKIVTSAAVLDLLGPDARFETSVVAGAAPDEIVLVAGGDPTLTVAERPSVPGGGTLDELARLVAAKLIANGVTSVQLGYDQSLFTGPAADVDWPSSYISSDVVAPVTALQVDGGRLEPGLAARADDPALDAAQEFAVMLADHGVTVAGAPAAVDGVSGDALAAIESPPLAAIVEYVLATSDNDVAESLARHAGLAGAGEASAAAAPTAVADALAALGVELGGASILDGSGLARGSVLTPESLVHTLNAAAEQPELRSVLTGLPVASFTGTLAERATEGGGSVRAKTGTLTGITSLAGTVLSADGTTYAFAAMADDISSTLDARAAMDEIAEAISQCGCG